jgi:hypothetical protein
MEEEANIGEDPMHDDAFLGDIDFELDAEGNIIEAGTIGYERRDPEVATPIGNTGSRDPVSFNKTSNWQYQVKSYIEFGSLSNLMLICLESYSNFPTLQS